MGVEVAVDGLSKSFGTQNIWRDVTLSLPPGEISVLLGPSGTGKSVLLKALVGLLQPEQGQVVINGVDVCTCSESDLYEIRKLFGVLFQDGALFGSMNLYDNIAFPLREHTRKGESEIRGVVQEKMEMVGLVGSADKLPGELSGGMRKRAGLARALVLDPEIILCDEPDSGLDPVRTAYLNQLIVDLNAQIDATVLIVTHDINTARTVPDNIGMLFRRNLVMFGPREVLLTSTEPVVEQFLNGRREGPIGMSEEKDTGQAAAEVAALGAKRDGLPQIIPQLAVSPGVPDRAAVVRRKDRVMRNLAAVDPAAQQEIVRTLTPQDRARYGVGDPERNPAQHAPAESPWSPPGAAEGATAPAQEVDPRAVTHPGRRSRPPSPTPRSDGAATSGAATVDSAESAETGGAAAADQPTVGQDQAPPWAAEYEPDPERPPGRQRRWFGPRRGGDR